MSSNEKIKEQIRQIIAVEESPESIERKLDELVFLLENGKLDSEQVKKLQHKFTTAVTARELNFKELEQFQELDDAASTREEHVINLENFLLTHQVDSTLSRKLQIAERAKQIARACIALLMITLGFSMIILPAPPNFEMFTIFYFNINDGVTLMDLISLLVVFTGIYLLITTFTVQRRHT